MNVSADPPGTPADLSLGVDLLSVVARLHRWATRNASLAMSPAQARLLAQIDELAPARIGDLARADHCSQPTMTTQARRLEDLGLVSRASDPGDARAVLIDVTEAGREALATMREARATAVAPMFANLTADDRAHLRAAIEVMDRLLDSQTAHPGKV